jgi:hypothetical protein
MTVTVTRVMAVAMTAVCITAMTMSMTTMLKYEIIGIDM